MKATGIVRKLDELGRVVIPKEVRTSLNLKDSDPVEIFVDDDGQIILRQYRLGCVFCDNMDGVLLNYAGKKICSACIQNLREYVKRLA
jgi:AbrB family transcriptional regulator, transcriptional pleiotropic regulator of transition state genes